MYLGPDYEGMRREKIREANVVKQFTKATTREAINGLLAKGLNIDSRDMEGRTALMLVKTAEQTKLLINANAGLDICDRAGQTALMLAESVEKIKVLIKFGADIDCDDKLGNTALMLTQSAEKTKLLIAAGANVNAENENGETALMLSESAEKTKLLIENGADVNAKTKYNDETALMRAKTPKQAQLLLDAGADLDVKMKSNLKTALDMARSDKPDVAKVIAARKAMPYYDEVQDLLYKKEQARIDKKIKSEKPVNKPDKNGYTKLMYAKTVEEAQKLIDAGADVNFEDKYFGGCNTPLSCAMENGVPDVAKLLIKNGADVNAKNYLRCFFIRETDKKWLDVVKEIIKAGAILEEEDEWCGTVLIRAVEYHSIEMIKLLINAGANVNTHDVNGSALRRALGAGDILGFGSLLKRGLTLDAIRNEGIEIATLLVNAGADVNEKNLAESICDRDLPLMLAVGSGNKKLVELMIAKGANVNGKTHNGRTPLMYTDDVEMAKLLIAKGADVNAKDRNGLTVLIRAKSAKIVKLLIENGANVNAKDIFGRTALLWAAKNGCTEIAKLLIANGADVDATDAKGHNALWYAKQNNRTNVVKVILQYEMDGLKAFQASLTKPTRQRKS